MHRDPVLLAATFLSSDERAWYQGERCWNCDPLPRRRRLLQAHIRK